MTWADKIQIVLAVLGVFLMGYCSGEAVGWNKAERWFWATREKK